MPTQEFPEQLDADSPEVRAAYLLACLKSDAHGDRLAELVTDDTPTTNELEDDRGASRDTSTDAPVQPTVGDAAVWALARMRDPRAVAGLRTRLLTGPIGYAVHYVSAGERVLAEPVAPHGGPGDDPPFGNGLVKRPAECWALSTRLA